MVTVRFFTPGPCGSVFVRTSFIDAAVVVEGKAMLACLFLYWRIHCCFRSDLGFKLQCVKSPLRRRFVYYVKK